MPTYSFVCPVCTDVLEAVMPIGEYVRHPPTFFHCATPMQRYFPPAGRKVEVVGDRHYDGLVAPDGSDISTRAKHREYMRRNGLTTIDDYRDSWAQAERRRDAYRQGQAGGDYAITRDDIARVMARQLDT